MKTSKGTWMIMAFLFNPGFPGKISDYIEYMRQVVDGLTGNTEYPTTDPTLADVTDALDDAQTAEIKFKDKQISKETRNAKVNASKETSTNLIRNIEYQTAGNAEKGSTTNIKMRKAGTARPAPEKPVILSLVAPIAGRATLKWKKVANAVTYLVRMSSDGGNTWTIIDAINSATYVAENLASIKQYIFMVKARNAAGESDWSQPAVVVTQ